MQYPLFKQKAAEHFLILFTLPYGVVKFIKEQKKKVFENYGFYISHDSVPHITLCTLKISPERVDKIVCLLEKTLSTFPQLEVEINGFDSFENTQVVYAKIENEHIFMPFYEALKRFKSEHHINDSLTISSVPHITLAKMVWESQFKQVTEEYESRKYNSSFILQELKVLRYDEARMKYEEFGKSRLRKAS